MLQIRKIMLRGKDVKDALVEFSDRANILAGESDTGKSYLIHCLDYIFGADEMKKRIPEAGPYSQLLVQFSNASGEYLTLKRDLAGGDLAGYRGTIEVVQGDGERIAPRRSGKSLAKDVTSLLFAFAGIDEAMLRRNSEGEKQRLTMRTLTPIFLIDEISVIDEISPVIGESGFDETARKRMLLSGKDDKGIIATEKKAIAKAKLSARLGLISDLLEPLERLQSHSRWNPEESIEKVEEAISTLSQTLTEKSGERASIRRERQEATANLQRAESQLLAIDELLNRYKLLDERYRTDLERLDFVSEGAHFFDSLQEVRCPLCEQVMTPQHAHIAERESRFVYEAAKAEAAKMQQSRVLKSDVHQG